MTTAEMVLPPHRSPYFFDEFFESGKLMEMSPFLTNRSRCWGKNLFLKASLLAAGLLMAAFLISFVAAAQSLKNLLLIGVYFLVGTPALINAIEDVLAIEINIDVLMTLAAFSSVLLGGAMEGGLLLVLFEVSAALEDTVTHKAQGALGHLRRLSPERVFVVEPDGHLIERSVKDISVGTTILVKVGEVVPLDGEVIHGASSVNLVHLTGENLPVLKEKGDSVPAGARNLEGALTLRVTESNVTSTVAQLIKLVTQAQEVRPRLQRWFDKFSQRYATGIIVFSVLYAVVLPTFIPIPFLGHEGSIYRALTFLIAASPCALIIAVPIAYLSAISSCARKGILLKGGITLDALGGCSVIAFDKTGTLTTGDLRLVGVEPLNVEDIPRKGHAMEVAYALEQNTTHPIARAVCAHAQEHHVMACPLEEFRAIPGRGVEAKAAGQYVFIGSAHAVQEKVQVPLGARLAEKLQAIRMMGELVSVLMIGSELWLLRFKDTPRPHIRKTMEALKTKGKYRLLMLTGDHVSNAKVVAEEVGVTEYHAGLTPEDKLLYVSELAQQTGLVMVGDGVNDAPALARATAGVCMGKVGSQMAIDAADVVLLQDNLERLPWLLDRSRLTRRIVRQNFLFALAAILGATTPALLGVIPLWLAVTLHEGGTIAVGLNALRLLRT